MSRAETARGSPAAAAVLAGKSFAGLTEVVVPEGLTEAQRKTLIGLPYSNGAYTLTKDAVVRAVTGYSTLGGVEVPFPAASDTSDETIAMLLTKGVMPMISSETVPEVPKREYHGPLRCVVWERSPRGYWEDCIVTEAHIVAPHHVEWIIAMLRCDREVRSWRVF